MEIPSGVVCPIGPLNRVACQGTSESKKGDHFNSPGLKMSAEKLEPRPAGQIPACDAHEHSRDKHTQILQDFARMPFLYRARREICFGRINFVAIRKQAYIMVPC